MAERRTARSSQAAAPASPSRAEQRYRADSPTTRPADIPTDGGGEARDVAPTQTADCAVLPTWCDLFCAPLTPMALDRPHFLCGHCSRHLHLAQGGVTRRDGPRRLERRISEESEEPSGNWNPLAWCCDPRHSIVSQQDILDHRLAEAEKARDAATAKLGRTSRDVNGLHKEVGTLRDECMEWQAKARKSRRSPSARIQPAATSSVFSERIVPETYATSRSFSLSKKRTSPPSHPRIGRR